MVRSLLEGAFALSLVVWLCGLLLTRRGKANISGAGSSLIPAPFWVVAALVPLAGFAATLPTRTPFAAGQGLGHGLLLGAVGAIAGAWTLMRAIPRKEGEGSGVHSGTGAFAASFALAVGVVCIPLCAMRGVVVDALMGVAVGWITATLLLLCGLNARDGAGRVVALGLMAFAAWAVTLCGWAALGELGGSAAWGANMTSVPWSAIAMPLASSVPLLLMLCAFIPGGVTLSTNLPAPAGRDITIGGRTSGLRWLAAGTLLLCVGVQFAHKIGIQPNLVRQLGLGLLASGLSWWMLSGRARLSRTPQMGGEWHVLALPLLLFMAAGMVSFQMLSGVGVGIMLLGAWLTAGIALLRAVEAEGNGDHAGEEDASLLPAGASLTAFDLLRLLCFGAILLLYRLFETRFAGDIRNVLLPDHYALLGFVVGVAVPAALSGFLNAADASEGDADNTTGASAPALLPRLLVLGAFALAAPALLLILFGTKCLLCLFFGLMLAPLIGGSAREARVASASTADAEDRSFRFVPVEMLTALFALAIGLAIAQWTRHVLPVSLMARADKVRLITQGAGLAAVLLLIANAGAFLRRLNALPSSHTDTTPKGGK